MTSASCSSSPTARRRKRLVSGARKTLPTRRRAEKGRSVDPERLQLAMQRRALHADELGRARDVAAEAVDLRDRYSRSKTSRASRSGRPISFSPPTPFGVAGTSAPTSGGQHVGRDLGVGSPPARIISRSTLLRSWRMLPGQSCDCSTAIASSPIAALRQARWARDLLHEDIGPARGCPRAARRATARGSARPRGDETGLRGNGPP